MTASCVISNVTGNINRTVIDKFVLLLHSLSFSEADFRKKVLNAVQNIYNEAQFLFRDMEVSASEEGHFGVLREK